MAIRSLLYLLANVRLSEKVNSVGEMVRRFPDRNLGKLCARRISQISRLRYDRQRRRAPLMNKTS